MPPCGVRTFLWREEFPASDRLPPAQASTDRHGDLAGYWEANLTISDETGKIRVILRVSFLGVSGEGRWGKISCAAWENLYSPRSPVSGEKEISNAGGFLIPTARE